VRDDENMRLRLVATVLLLCAAYLPVTAVGESSYFSAAGSTFYCAAQPYTVGASWSHLLPWTRPRH